MPQSLAMLLTHIVFAMKNRQRFISADVQNSLYAYMSGILIRQGCRTIIMGGWEDHVHILCSLSKTIAPCKIVEEVKTGSSKWLKTRGPALEGFHWQDGYGMISVSPGHIESIRCYIRDQEQHHRRVSFQDEYRRLMEENGIAYDEAYVWD